MSEGGCMSVSVKLCLCVYECVSLSVSLCESVCGCVRDRAPYHNSKYHERGLEGSCINTSYLKHSFSHCQASCGMPTGR